MYQAIVFFDLDGTLLDSQKQVQSSSLEAIQTLKQKHILPVIATGRHLLMVKAIMKKTGIETVISANGSYIQQAGHAINTINIPDKIIAKLVQVSKKLQHPLAFQTPQQIVLSAETNLTKAAYAKHAFKPHVNPDFYHDHALNFVNLFCKDHDKFYQDKFANQLDIVRNSEKCLDVTACNVSKQSGIRILLKKLHCENVTTYCFGDGLNDLEMFQEVTHPIAMGNGYQKDKQSADFVTATDDQDGIAKGLKHYHLI